MLGDVKLRVLARQMLETDGLAFEEAGPLLRLAYAGENGRFLLVVRTDEEHQQVVCFALSPVEAGNRLDAVTELAHRLNATLATVAFDVDVDSGVIRCRAGIDVEGAAAADATVCVLIGNVVYAAAAAMDQALPAITAVVVKGLEPRRAMSSIV